MTDLRVTREKAINYLMGTGLFKRETLEELTTKEIETLLKTAIESQQYNAKFIKVVNE